MPVTKFQHHLFHLADIPNNLTSSFLARSHHPKTERKKLTTTSLGNYRSHLHPDLIIFTVMVNHLNCLIFIMILSRRDDPGAQKNSCSVVNGIEKGNANEKEKGKEIHDNENPPIP